MLTWKNYRIKARESYGVVILDLGGRIVGSQACEQLRKLVDHHLADANGMILLNLQRVKLIDSHGLAAIMGACNHAWQQGADVKLVIDPSNPVHQAFDYVLFTPFLDIYESEKEAVTSFKQAMFARRLGYAEDSGARRPVAEPPRERRSQRVPLVTSVGVVWEAPNKYGYRQEPAETLVVSAHGALLRIQHDLPIRQLVEVSRVNEFDSLALVVESGLPSETGWRQVAIELAVPNESLWGRASGAGQADSQFPETRIEAWPVDHCPPAGSSSKSG